MITQRVNEALTIDRARRANVSGAGGSRQSGGPVACECTFDGFMKCNPTVFNGIEGAVELQRWFRKTESVLDSVSVRKTRKLSSMALHSEEVQRMKHELWNLTNYQKQGNAQAMTTAPNESNAPAGLPSLSNRYFVHHTCPCTIQCQKCEKVGNNARYCKERMLPLVQMLSPFGLVMIVLSKDIQETTAQIRTSHKVGMLVVELIFSHVIDINPDKLNVSYEVELADGKVVKTNTVLRGCTLNLVNHLFKIDLMLVEFCTFNVIIRMDWFAERNVVIIYSEKVVRIPYGNKTLILKGDKGPSRLKVISCIKARKYIKRVCQMFVAQVTEEKSKKKRLEDMPVIRDSHKVFPDNFSGLAPPRQVEFKIDLVPGSAPVAQAPYCLAPSEIKELSSTPDGKLIHNSILNGPYVRKMIPEPGDANRDITVTETFHLQTDDELSDKELKQIEADDQAIQSILLGLPEDIYAAVDSYETAQEIWLRVSQMMKGELIESYYHHFLKLMNDLKRNKHFPEKIARNGNKNKIGNGNLVAARAEGNAAWQNGNQIRCYNCRGKEKAGIQLQAEEYDLIAAAADLDEIEEVNANFILIANLQQASTSGTQTESTPVYDIDGSAEVHENCDDNKIFNMFTQEEQYTELLEPILESHQVSQNDNDVIFEDTSVEQGREIVEQHPANFEETRALYESLYQNLAIEVEKVNSEAAKFVRDFKSLANEADASLAKHKALEWEIKRLLKAVVSQDFMIIVQNESIVDTSDLQTELERTKEHFENCIIKKETEYAKFWNDWYKKYNECRNDNISYDKAYKDMQQKIERLQAQFGDLKGMFRINPSKTSREEKHVPNTVSACARTKPITVSQPHVITKKDANSDLNGLSSTGVDNTKTRRPQPRSNTKNDRITLRPEDHSLGAEVEEHHRNLLLSKNNKHISSACNNIKIASQDVISKVVCATCKKCLISVNHDKCLSNYVNAKNSCGKNQKAKISFKENQMKYQPKVTKPKKVEPHKSHATPKPKKSRFLLRWSPTGRFFNQEGKLVDSSKSKSKSDCSNDDNACTSNTMEPKIKRFPNSTSLLNRLFRFVYAAILGFGDLQWGNILITRVYFVKEMVQQTFIQHEMASALPIYLMALASSTKSWLWHQRLSHLNFDTINDLAKNDPVVDLPKFKYHKEHLCPFCEQGKSKRASHPPKPVPNSRQRLHLLYMDLCGPMRIASINGKRCVLVIVDDISRYTWVHFLRSKDKAPEVIIKFLKRITVLQFNKTPYELINDRKPDISFLHVFGALFYPKNDHEDIGKLGAKGDIGFFIGYSTNSCAYRVYNRQIKKIMETMNVSFDELSAMSFEQRSSKPKLNSMNSEHISSGLDLTYAPSTITTQQPSEGELYLLSEAMYDDYIGGQPSATARTILPAQEP
nr:putative reverse transcriptase domain-containing protein [Tanacetum cinerariifolium]